MEHAELDAVCRLSRHASLRAEGGALVAESARTGERFPAPASVASLLFSFVRPRRVGDLLEGLDERQRAALLGFVRRCRAAGLLVEVDADGEADEDRGAAALWEPHDLMLHTRSRIANHPNPRLGATYRFRGILPPEPAVKPDRTGRVVELERADFERLEREDWTLTRALEERRTRYSVEPVSLADLGVFLHRTCRLTGLSEMEGTGQTARKVYPSGGSLHPLEVYVAAARCDGLENGLYHYHPARHHLTEVAGWTDGVRALLDDARRGAGLPAHPSVLLVASARFRRTAWKYEGLAYRLVLSELGALYQTMYLVATAMGLAPCALGAGNASLFSETVGEDPLEETSVGELVLGGGSPRTHEDDGGERNGAVA